MANVRRSNGFIYAQPLGCGGTGAAPIWHCKLRSNHIIRFGDVMRGSNGLADMTNIATTDGIIGVSQYTNTTSTATNVSITFIPAVPWVVFEAQSVAVGSIGQVFGAHRLAGATGAQRVSVGATTSMDTMRCIGLGTGDNTSIGVNREMLVVFQKSRLIGLGQD